MLSDQFAGELATATHPSSAAQAALTQRVYAISKSLVKLLYHFKYSRTSQC
jgi:hypothetical protein